MNSPNQPMQIVQSIEEVLKAPVAPGISIPYKDANEDYIYVKSMSTQGTAEYKAYHTEETNFYDLLPENKKLAGLATADDVNALASCVKMLADQVSDIKDLIGSVLTKSTQSDPQENNTNYHNNNGGKKNDRK